MIQASGDCDGVGGEGEDFEGSCHTWTSHSFSFLVCLFSGGPGVPLGGWWHNGPYLVMSSEGGRTQFIFTAAMLFLPAGGRNLKRDSYSQILKLKADSRRQCAGKRDTILMDFEQNKLKQYLILIDFWKASLKTI